MKNIKTFNQFSILEAKKPKKEKEEVKKDDKKSKKGLSAKQKKLPPALQSAILKRQK